MPTDSDLPPTSKVVGLCGTHPQIFKHGEPNEEVVERLKEMLKEAESGYLRAFSYARVTADRDIIHGWCGSCDAHDMIAGVAQLQHRLMTDNYNREEEK